MLTILFFLPLLLDEGAAQARLEQIRARFTQMPKEQSVAALLQLGNDAPDTQGGARALAWLGDLEHVQHQDALAAEFYRRSYAAHVGGEAHRLAARGLGDVAMGEKRYGEAARKYREASIGATGVLAAELELKVALAERLGRRAVGEWAAWIFLALTLIGFLARARPWQRPHLGAPTELVYTAPVYVLLIAGAWGRDANVEHALWMAAFGSLLLIAAAGLAARRRPPVAAQRWLHATLLVAANAALFYAACNRAMIIDGLFYTVAAP